ncbi:uncharacterized protein N7511_002558 [Penicillium nucicola]|uniref:uncharacterized protein n=1 Tax=Penicillium nucicola TaxID=1850975 RepID=UPI0025452084|nr:uncharacterized protein N7511_002558 [Penicillium nucicola]KAJ5770507.1 hypothetical protein N7511_002558 [Penicillium nucicola]
MASSKKKKASDKKVEDGTKAGTKASTKAGNKAGTRVYKDTKSDQLRLEYQNATMAAMNQVQPFKQTDHIKQEQDDDDFGDSEETTPTGDVVNQSDDSNWDDEEEEDHGHERKARPNRKNRSLVRWSDDTDIHLLLCITYVCQKDKVKLPWKRIAEKMSEQVPHTTEGAISQHLSKVRTSRRGGTLEPPSPIRKPKSGCYSTEKSDSVPPKQPVNKKSKKRARDTSPSPLKKHKRGKKSTAAKDSATTYSRLAGNDSTGNTYTRLVNSVHAGLLRCPYWDMDREKENDEELNNANNNIHDSEMVDDRNVLRLSVPSLSAGNLNAHTTTGNTARIPASQYYGSGYIAPADLHASGAPNAGHFTDYHTGYGNLNNGSLLNQHANPFVESANYLGYPQLAWPSTPATSTAAEAPFVPSGEYTAALSTLAGYGLFPPMATNSVPWHETPSTQYWGLPGDEEEVNEVDQLMGPRAPVPRAPEEITWKQEEDEEE